MKTGQLALNIAASKNEQDDKAATVSPDEYNFVTQNRLEASQSSR